MGDLSLKTVSERIVDAVLEQPVFNREQLLNVVRPILNVWIKKTNVPRERSTPSLNKYGKTVITAQKSREEKNYWKNIVKAQSTNDQMKEYYNGCNKLLNDLGYEQ